VEQYGSISGVAAQAEQFIATLRMLH
jgi:hypothetical protein